MYHIFIKTPPYQKTNYMPHLLEHCVVNNFLDNEKNFITYFNSITAYTTSRYTQYSCDTKKCITLLSKHLLAPIPQKRVDHEVQRIHEEYSETTYQKRLFEKLQKTLDPESWSILKKHSVSKKSLWEYQNTYYNTYILTDDNYNIVFSNVSVKEKNRKKTTTSDKVHFQNYKYKLNNITFQWRKNTVLYHNYNNASDIYIGDFIATLLRAWIDFHAANITPQYHLENIGFFKTEKHIIITIPTEYIETIKSLSQSFFDEYKAHYCATLLNNLPNVLCVLANKPQISTTDLKLMIMSLSYKEFHKMMW